MTMKNKFIWILTAISFIITAAAMNFLPEEVPMHFDFSGNVDRYGSRYEMLLFPGLLAAMALFWSILLAWCEKKRKNADEKTAAEAQNNIKILRISAAVIMIMEFVLQCSALITAFRHLEQPVQVMPAGFSSLVCAAVGIAMAAMGNLMPKSKRNGLFGIRTSWSMENDQTWLASNRFGGAVFFAAGAAVTVLSLILRGMTVVYVMSVIISLAAAVSIAYSHYAYKKYKDQQGA